MDCARDLGVKVYLNHYSGWPAGGEQILLADGIQSLAMVDFTVKGGRLVERDIPGPQPGFNAYIIAVVRLLFDYDFGAFPKDKATLLSAVAMKKMGGARSHNPLDITDTLVLDADEAIVLDPFILDGRLVWDAPDGEWTIVATYILPAAEGPVFVAQERTGFVVNHLSTDQIIGHYNWSYGQRTGLLDHAGKSFSGFFNDSLEFTADRLASSDILQAFEERRGYDLRPYLPAIMIDGIDNFYLYDALKIHGAPHYQLTDKDERIRWDYQQTLSDLIIERFLEGSAEWAEKRGLHSRGQSYGMDLDVIRALGANHIPETEQLYASSLPAFQKLAASAGALYSRPLISAEAFVWNGHDYAVAPRQIKAAADVLFSSGVNQLIYHGISHTPTDDTYKDGYGDLGWYPFSAHDTPSHFSGNYGVGSVAWEAMPELNSYMTRSQKLLQAGRPEIDVFIYYPWLGFPTHFRLLPGIDNVFLANGYMPDANRNRGGSSDGFDIDDIPFTNIPESDGDIRIEWLSRLSPFIAELDRQGVTWAWANGHALQNRGRLASKSADADINKLVVFDTEAMNLSTVGALERLLSEGTDIIFAGMRPTRQPGYLNAEENDSRLKSAIEAFAVTKRLKNAEELKTTVVGPIHDQRSSNVKRVRRTLETGETIDFFTNLSVTEEHVNVAVELKQGELAYWFDAMTGTTWQAHVDADGFVALNLPALVSRFLIVTETLLTTSEAPLASLVDANAVEAWNLSSWSLRSGDRTLTFADTFPDLRDSGDFRYAKDLLVYTTNLPLEGAPAGQRFVLDLERVEGVAKVTINGGEVGTLSLHPFQLDVTDALQDGDNVIVVSVQPPARNKLVGRALEGDPLTAHLTQYKEDLVMTGIVGPVSLRAYSLSSSSAGQIID